MTAILGLLNISDSDLTYINQIGQAVIYDATNRFLTMAQAALQETIAIFVETTTEKYSERYKLPGGGRLQQRGTLAPTAAGSVTGHWDVAYPLRDYGQAIGATDVDLAYTTAREYQRQLDGILIRNTNTVRFEVLKALFNNTARTVADDQGGNITVQPLANGDSVLYPPVDGSETEATDDHYLESGYAASAISDTNNPLETIRAELEEHSGASTGGDDIVVFHNVAQAPKLKLLAEFNEVPDRFVSAGANVSTPIDLPRVPGKVLGRASGVWLVQWPYIPANYLLGIHMGQLPPLKMRVDTAASGLPRGLHTYYSDDKRPIETMEWRHRFGFGVGNRLNGVVMELGTGGSYTIPTIYA